MKKQVAMIFVMMVIGGIGCNGGTGSSSSTTGGGKCPAGSPTADLAACNESCVQQGTDVAGCKDACAKLCTL